MVGDRELVRRSLAGEAEAFHGLVERYREPLYRVGYRFLGNHHDALEITQEAFARAWEKLERFDLSRPFSTWLFAIAANLSRDILRKRGRRNLVLSDERIRMEPGGPAPEGAAAEREEAERLRRAVAELDEDKRMAIVLRYFEGKSLKEIAEITGTEVNTMKVRLFRARKELQGRLEAQE
jgi:RNA polymerase sigma-70 factor (ECF subfamily)